MGYNRAQKYMGVYRGSGSGDLLADAKLKTVQKSSRKLSDAGSQMFGQTDRSQQ